MRNRIVSTTPPRCEPPPSPVPPQKPSPCPECGGELFRDEDTGELVCMDHVRFTIAPDVN